MANTFGSLLLQYDYVDAITLEKLTATAAMLDDTSGVLQASGLHQMTQIWAYVLYLFYMFCEENIVMCIVSGRCCLPACLQ